MIETRQNNVQFQRPIFLPMLCSRPSIKNVTLPSKPHQDDQSSCLQQETDPLSPKISCIGQVKRSNKIAGFPTTTTTTITPATHQRYFKLKRLFSSKNLTFSAPATTTTSNNRTSRGRPRKEEFGNKRIAVIDVAELDPPLPVVKKIHDGDKQEESLWKRRAGGGRCQLPSLEIQTNGANHLKVTTV